MHIQYTTSLAIVVLLSSYGFYRWFCAEVP